MKISIAPAACPGKFPQGIVGAFYIFFFRGKEVRQGEMQMATPAAYGSNSINVPEGFRSQFNQSVPLPFPAQVGRGRGWGISLACFL